MPVYPISISIPEQKIVNRVPDKSLKFATLTPGDVSTYIYKDESSYYKGYQEAVFGRTSKKCGWDCLRHYEILANGCIPWFTDLDKCPSATMTHFPKQLVLDAMHSKTPTDFIPRLLEYTKKHLTCRAMAQYIFDTVGCSTPKKVLFLSGDANPDYLRCLTLIGMKEILGNRCIESVFVPHIYEDFSNPTSLYGKGFTYTRILPVSYKPSPVHIDELRNGSFDLIVYGSLHRGMPYWDEVTLTYPPQKIVILCGEDCDQPTFDHHSACNASELSREKFNLFVRELL